MIIHLIAKFALTRIITFVSPKYQINNSYQILDNKKKNKEYFLPTLIKPFYECPFFIYRLEVI